METMIPKGLAHMVCAVVGSDDYCVSLHQHPDAAQRLIDSSPRTDLRIVYLPELPGHEIRFDEGSPF